MKKLTLLLTILVSATTYGQFNKKYGSTGQSHGFYGSWFYRSIPVSYADSQIVAFKSLKDSAAALRTAIGTGTTNIVAKQGLTRTVDTVKWGGTNITEDITVQGDVLAKKDLNFLNFDSLTLDGLINRVLRNLRIVAVNAPIMSWYNNSGNELFSITADNSSGLVTFNTFNSGFPMRWSIGSTEGMRFNGFRELQLGSATRIGTGLNKLQVTGGTYLNGSLRIDKDSIRIVSNPTGMYIHVIDTTNTVDNNLTKRLTPSYFASQSAVNDTAAAIRTAISGSGGMTNPMTAASDIIVGGASGTPQRLAAGTANQILGRNNGATALEYKTLTSSASVNVAHGTGAVTFSIPTSFLTTDDYTATIDGVLNVDATAMIDAQYSLQNDMVTYSGSFTIDATTLDAPTTVDLSLPIATSSTKIYGTAIGFGDKCFGGITASSGKARVRITSVGVTSNIAYSFIIQYRVIP